MTYIKELGNLLSITFDNGFVITAYPTGNNIWLVPDDVSHESYNNTVIQQFGNLLNIVNSDGTHSFAYPTHTDIWLVDNTLPDPGTGGGVINPPTTGWVWPLDKTKWVVTSEYGMRVNPVTGVYTLHAGIDISGSGVYGTSIISPFNGTVVMAQVYSGYGQHVKVNHTDGSQTSFSHMVSGYVPVTVGQVITTGTIVGQVNNTGSSTGSHLHYETKNAPGQTSVNPRDFMTARGNTW